MMKCPACGARYSASERLCPKDGTVLEHEQSLDKQFIGKTLDGKYRLDSFLSRGGMGAVFRGTHVMLNRPVAVKMINAHLVTSPEIVRRFQREARAATQLNHPNIVDVYDLGQTAEGTLYIVMELVAGHSLKEEIRKRGPLEEGRIVQLLSQVCNGLDAAHRANIVHRDLKPQNIMVTKDHSGAEIAKIVDFGIAKTFEIDAHTQLTADGATLGTPHYMSPEQATGREVDGRSDIYSLGIILYEMLTGVVPFDDQSMAGLLIKHMSEVPAPPSQRRPDLEISPALEAIALRCLAKDPEARFATAREMGDALRNAPVTFGPSGHTAAGVATVPHGGAVVPPPLPVADVTAPSRPATHPTAPAMTPTLPSSASVVAAPPPTRSSRGPALLVAAFLVLMSLVSGFAYWLLMRGDRVESETITTEATPPTASPAGGTVTTIPENPTMSASPSPITDSAPPPAEAAEARSVPGGVGTRSTPGAAGPTGTPVTPRARSTAPPGEGVPNASATSAAPGAPGATSESQLPPVPTVSFQCRGVPELCAPLSNEIQSSLQRAGMTLRRSGADVNITAEATLTDQRTQESFGTMMTINTYSVQLEADAPRFDNDVISLPHPPPVSADPRVGTERFVEYARKIAPEVVERVSDFWTKRRQ